MSPTASKKKKGAKENSKTDKTRKSTRKLASASKSPAKNGGSSVAAPKTKGKGKKKTGIKKGIETNDDDGLEQDEEEPPVDEPPVEEPSRDDSDGPGGAAVPEIIRRIGWNGNSSGSQASGTGNGTGHRRGTMDLDDELERASQANETLRVMLERRENEVSDYRNQLTKVQSEALIMKEQFRSLKRAATEPAEGEEEVPKKKGKIVKEDQYKHAATAGKKYTALYDAWGSKESIFEGFRAAALEAGALQEEDEESDSDNSDDDDSSSSGSSSDDEDSRSNRKAAKGVNSAAGEDDEATTHLDFADPEVQEAFTKESAARFWKEAKASELKGWQKAKYKSRFMDAASRMRSAFRENTEDPRVVFGFNIEAKEFGRSTRKALPEVVELLENTTFLPNSDDGPELAYRHPCLLQIARRILNGKAALLNGKKSPMAREVFATQWRIKRVTVHFIAIVAYMAFFILSGEETLSHAPNTIEVYWEHLDSLLRLEKGTSTFIEDLISYWNVELGIKDATKKKPVNRGKDALLRAFGA